MRKSNKEFIPVWGWWVVISFCLALVIGFLFLTGSFQRIGRAIQQARQTPPTITPPPANPPQSKPISPPPAPPPPPPRSMAEIVIDEVSRRSNLNRDDKIRLEIARLAVKEKLWVRDFQPLMTLAKQEKDPLVMVEILAIFGKPDAESVYTVTDSSLQYISFHYHVDDYIYTNRIVNPITGKPESLTIKFCDLQLQSAIAESGNKIF